jgi:hypothetical protein
MVARPEDAVAVVPTIPAVDPIAAKNRRGVPAPGIGQSVDCR